MTYTPLDLTQLEKNAALYRAPWKIGYSDGSGPNCVTDKLDNCVCQMGHTLEDGEQEQQMLIVVAPDLLADAREARKVIAELVEAIDKNATDCGCWCVVPENGCSNESWCSAMRSALALAAPWIESKEP